MLCVSRKAKLRARPGIVPQENLLVFTDVNIASAELISPISFYDKRAANECM